jgi:hypothetical protein
MTSQFHHIARFVFGDLTKNGEREVPIIAHIPEQFNTDYMQAYLHVDSQKMHDVQRHAEHAMVDAADVVIVTPARTYERWMHDSNVTAADRRILRVIQYARETDVALVFIFADGLVRREDAPL